MASSGRGRVLGWFVATFLAPPAAWLVLIWYGGLVDGPEVLKVGTGVALWGYVAVWLSIMVFILRRQLQTITDHLENPEEAGDEDPGDRTKGVRQTIARIPWLLTWGMVVYAALGPAFATMGHDFLDATELKIAMFTGLPLVLVLSVPLHFRMVRALDEWTAPIAICERYHYSLRTRIWIPALVPAVGVLVVICTFVASLLNAFPDIGARELVTRLAVVSAFSAGTVALSIAALLRQMGRQLDETMALALRVANGDLSRSAFVGERDEVGLVTQALNQTMARLNRIIGGDLKEVATAMTGSGEIFEVTAGDLREGVDQLHAQVGAVNTACVALGSGADRVATSTAAAFERLGEAAEQASDAETRVVAVAHAADEMAGNVVTVAAAIEQMGATLNEIAQGTVRVAEASQAADVRAGETREAMKGLGLAAERIGKVVSLIANVADRTNLLALNAAIEAAGAGEAGRGFAVVAQEVKALAAQTASATAEISIEVAEIQKSTIGVGEMINSVTSLVSNVTEHAHVIAAAVEEQTITTAEISSNTASNAEAASLMSEEVQVIAEAVAVISGSIGEMMETVGEISAASDTLAENTEHVKTAMDEIVGAAELTGEGVMALDEAAHASARDAGRLHDVMGYFDCR